MSIVGPNVAGSWYPAGADELARQVDGHLGAEPPADDARCIRALIAPHAGFAYSGDVAGRTFCELRGSKFRRVLLLGPSHYVAFDGAAVPEAAKFRTPLGDIAVDSATIERLRGRPAIRHDDSPFVREHSLEAELPFLQRCLGAGFELVPVLVGGGSPAERNEEAASALGDLVDAETLVVVSSDFTHHGRAFGYAPFSDDLPRRIRELDMGAVERILAIDAAGFDDYVRETGATICGRGPIGVLLKLLSPRVTAGLLSYDISGRLTGDWSHTVSYAGIAFRGGGR